MPPTIRAGSSSLDATAARPSGKLAPQRMAPGSTAKRHRVRSSWNWNHGLVEIDGLIGQYGSESLRMNAVHAMAPHSSSWHHARAMRGRESPRPSADPRLLPMPMPVRNTAMMSENVYVVAPNRSDSV